MSSNDDDEIENAPKNGIYERKPKYVKRLNFGQTILNSNTVDRSHIFNSNNFIINTNVARIPSTEKEDFVRRWIETHNCNNDLSSSESNQSSPVLGASQLKPIETSPILGTCNHRSRTKSKSGKDVMKTTVHNRIEMSPVLGSIKQKNRKKLHFTTEKKQDDICTDNSEDVHGNPFFTNSRHDNLPNARVNNSPVLIRDTYCYKRKRRRTTSNNDQARKLDTATMVTDDGTDKNMNLLVSLNVSKDLNPLSPEIPSCAAKYKIRSGKSKKLYDRKKNTLACSSQSLAILVENKIKRNSSKDNTNHVIESVSSSDSNTKDATSNDDDGIGDIIEDIDTQEMIPLPKTSISKDMNKWIVASPKSPNETFYLQAESNKNKGSSVIQNKGDVDSPKDSDRTFFSKAESVLSVASLPPKNSQDKISQVTIFSNDSVDGRSSQTNFAISNVTSPTRTNSYPGMSLQIIDSCKKKRRVKKKSLAGKLQTLISRQTSFVRMWHHQMKQADMDGTSMPHIVVYVDKCTVHFYRQLLEGIVLDDPFHILYNNENDDKSNISKSSSTKLLNKMITMFIVPDIVGKIEMNSESIVKVYPPWDMMDESQMILNVTYIKIMSNEQKNLILSKIKMPDRKRDKVLTKEFNCLCLEVDKILPSCKRRLSNEKPDVMEELFKF